VFTALRAMKVQQVRLATDLSDLESLLMALVVCCKVMTKWLMQPLDLP